MGFGSNKGFTPGGDGAGASGIESDAVITDDAVVRGDGGARKVQDSSWTITDAGALAGGTSISGSTTLSGQNIIVDGNIGVTGDASLLNPASGTVTFNIGDVAGSDLKIINAGGTSVLHVEGDTQRVGIGTTSPDYKLEIDGTTDFGDTTTYKNGEVGLVSWNTTAGNHKFIVRAEANYDLSLGGNANDEQLYISGSTGDVGIGTTAPEALLHVHTGDSGIAPHAGAKDFVVESNGTVGMSILGGEDNSARIYFGSSKTFTPLAQQVRAGQIDYNLQDDIMKLATSGSTRITIDAAGDVGIGVTDPDAQLEVYAASTQLKLSYDPSNHATQTVADDGELVVTTTGAGADITLDPGSQIIYLGAGDASAATHIHAATAGGVIEERYKIGDTSHFTIVVDETPDKVRFALGDGKQIVMTTIDNRLKNHDHTTPADPTLFVHSNTDPDTDHTQWVSLSHNQTDAILEMGSGSLVISGAVGDYPADSGLGNKGQLRIAYDGSNYTDFYVGSSGDLFITASGGDSTFSTAGALRAVKNGDVFVEVDAGAGANSNRKFQLGSSNGAPNGQGSIGSSNYPETIVIKGNKAVVGIGGVVEPVAALHVSASHGAHNGGPVFQADSAGAGVIFAVTGSEAIGGGEVTITGSLVHTAATAVDAAGANFAGAVYKTHISKTNGIIHTQIYVDFGGAIKIKETQNTVLTSLAADGGSDASFTKITTAKNGAIFKGKVTCLESPDGALNAQAANNLGIAANTAQLAAGALYTAGAAGLRVCTEGGMGGGVSFVTGKVVESGTDALTSNLSDYWLYFYNAQATTSTTYNSYTTGQFLVELWGVEALN
jgi:hypothetical protein